MPYYCTVPRCTSMAGKAKNVSFHQFPRDEELAKLWNRILKRGKPYTKYSKVCSLHFKPEDYTITSVGKNKGQWRTLRKDAIPSQNLPSESPVPHTRQSSGCWVPSQPTLTDPVVQQQMAQAIYMQTMLAMQAAGASESISSSGKDFHSLLAEKIGTESFLEQSSNAIMQAAGASAILPPNQNGTVQALLFGGRLREQPPQIPESTNPSPSSSSLSEIELLLRRDADHPKEVTYKCHECTKCFKDPDVFILHKRTHKKDTTNNIEKENYSTNIQDREETLRANPILANLLKTSMRLEPETNMSNILTVENQIMAALASNMEAYIRTLSSMLTNQTNRDTEENNEHMEQDSDYEDETKDACKREADEVDEDDEDTDGREDDSVDTNKNDQPMEDIQDRFSVQVTASVSRIEPPIDENQMFSNDDNSADNTTKEDTYECRDIHTYENQSASDGKSINDNESKEIHEASQNHETNDKIDRPKDTIYDTQNDAILYENHENINENKMQDEKILKDTAVNESLQDNSNAPINENDIADDRIDTASQQNEAYDGKDTNKDKNDDIEDTEEVNNEVNDGKLDQDKSECGIAETELIRIEIESKT